MAKSRKDWPKHTKCYHGEQKGKRKVSLSVAFRDQAGPLPKTQLDTCGVNVSAP